MRIPAVAIIWALLVFPGALPACLNDSVTQANEHEFRSRYSLATSSAQSGWNWLGVVISIGNAGVIGASVAILIMKPKSR